MCQPIFTTVWSKFRITPPPPPPGVGFRPHPPAATTENSFGASVGGGPENRRKPPKRNCEVFDFEQRGWPELHVCGSSCVRWSLFRHTILPVARQTFYFHIFSMLFFDLVFWSSPWFSFRESCNVWHFRSHGRIRLHPYPVPPFEQEVKPPPAVSNGQKTADNRRLRPKIRNDCWCLTTRNVPARAFFFCVRGFHPFPIPE